MLEVDCILKHDSHHWHYMINTYGHPCVGIKGASGCGKSTLIRILAGFEARAVGRVTLAGYCLQDSNKSLFIAPEDRQAGVVMQDSCLFPHLSVHKNIRFGSRLQTSSSEVDEIIDVFELGPLLARKPHQLSGGEQRRVALARALCCKPRYMLLDEPLTGVDSNMKVSILRYLKRQNKQGLPMVYVSHLTEELHALCSVDVEITHKMDASVTAKRWELDNIK